MNDYFKILKILLKNESRIPPQLLPHTNTCLGTVRFSGNDILKVIRKLDPRKAHGHDKISIRILKLTDKAICKTFAYDLYIVLRNRSFSDPLEKS